jgi:polyhydroxyalkanoate synthesis regulator phasin
MIDLLKKAVLTGIGVASLTKEKIEEVSRDFIDKGKLSEKEGEKFVEEMLSRADESKQSLKKQTECVVEATLDKMQLARASDIENLKAEIGSLRDEIESLRKE